MIKKYSFSFSSFSRKKGSITPIINYGSPLTYSQSLPESVEKCVFHTIKCKPSLLDITSDDKVLSVLMLNNLQENVYKLRTLLCHLLQQLESCSGFLKCWRKLTNDTTYLKKNFLTKFYFLKLNPFQLGI